MKKWFFLLLSLPVFLSSCNKDDANKCNYVVQNITAPAAEVTALSDFLTANSITATQHSSGLFYSIADPGTGGTAAVCSTITVNYEGSLLANGHVFEANTSTAGVSFVLGQAIPAWQYAVPLIKGGGTITIYIPPSLAYGSITKYDNVGNVAIPANSYLKFVINLRDVQ